MSASLAAAQFVTGRLHKRSRSGNKTPEEIPDEMFDEGFFSGPGSPPPTELGFKKSIKSKNKIKPLLKKVSGSSRNNSLDLSRSNGGLAGIGLGIYENNGYESSGVDEDVLETAFPSRRPKRHQRGTSSYSVQSSVNSPLVPCATPTQPFAHPKRQVPRRGAYTPDLSRDGTSNESSEDEEDDERETRRRVLEGSANGPPSALTINTNYDGTSTPILITHVASSPSVADLESFRARTPYLSSPTSPTSSPLESAPKIKSRGRLSVPKEKLPEPSPSFAASVMAARLAWEAKEEKKEAKRESKRRRSEAKDGERRTNSQNSNLGSNSGTIWDTEESTDSAYQEGGNSPQQAPAAMELDDDVVYTGRASLVDDSRGRNATGKKWGVLGDQLEGRKRGGKRLGLKKRWLGFIVWVRIGMVRLRRKMGFSSPT